VPTQKVQPTAQTEKARKRRPFLKRLMGFEPTTFCMASRACAVDSAANMPANGRFSGSGCPGMLPGVHPEFTVVWVPNGYRGGWIPALPGLLGGDFLVWPSPGADAFVQDVRPDRQEHRPGQQQADHRDHRQGSDHEHHRRQREREELDQG
jgi:hypothetical protein